ncbi:unnamed protein product [Penicillium olsonii]|nr:unnamed protein product [Penicillium olsonii]
MNTMDSLMSCLEGVSAPKPIAITEDMTPNTAFSSGIPRTFLFDSDQTQSKYAESLGALLALEISKSDITSQQKIEVLSILAKIKASVEIKSVASNGGKTALTSAVEANDLNLVAWLLDHDADIDATDNAGHSALSYAVSSNNVSMVRVLLGRGPLLNILDKAGKTVLELAAHNIKLVEILLDAGADIELQNGKSLTLLDTAVVERNTELVHLLVARGAILQRDTSLHITVDAHVVGASSFDGIQAPNSPSGVHIAILLTPSLSQPVLMRLPTSFKLGAKAVHEIAPLGLALDESSLNLGYHSSQEVKLSENKRTVRTAQAERYQGTEAGTTEPPVDEGTALLSQEKKDIALNEACESLNANMITKLLTAGANPDADIPGKTNATITVCCESPVFGRFSGKNHLAIQALIDHGVDLNTGYEGRLPNMLSAAALNLDASSVKFLLENGADPFFGDSVERLPVHFAAGNTFSDTLGEILDRASATMLALDSTQRSPLHFAAQFGNARAVSTILNKIDSPNERRKHVNQPDLDGWTPICWAIRGSKTPNANTEGYLETMKLLLKHGADIAIRFPTGSESQAAVTTPWHIANLYNVEPQMLDLIRREIELVSPGETVRPRWKQPIMTYNKEVGHCAICLSGIRGKAYKCNQRDDFRICHKCYGIRHAFVYIRPLPDSPGNNFIVEDTFEAVKSPHPEFDSSGVFNHGVNDL